MLGPHTGRGRPRRAAALLGVMLGALACGPDLFPDDPEQLQLAHALRFVVQPTGGRVGQALQPVVEVEVVDVHGERVRGLEALVGLRVPSHTQADNLHGASTFTRDGRARFPALIVLHAGVYELEAHGMLLVPARSRSFTVVDALSAEALREEARPVR